MSNDRFTGLEHGVPALDAPKLETTEHSGGVTMAFLEDDMVLRLCVETVFEGSGNTVVGASTPAALLESLRAEGRVPDILVTDHHVGRRGAVPVSVSDLLAAIGRPLPVIVTTGDESPATLAEIRRGGWRFLGKPYDPDTLRDLVLSMLGRSE